MVEKFSKIIEGHFRGFLAYCSRSARMSGFFLTPLRPSWLNETCKNTFIKIILVLYTQTLINLLILAVT